MHTLDGLSNPPAPHGHGLQVADGLHHGVLAGFQQHEIISQTLHGTAICRSVGVVENRGQWGGSPMAVP